MILFIFLIPSAQAAEFTAEEIMFKNYESSRFNSSRGEADVGLMGKNGDVRSRKIITLSKLNIQSGDNARLSRFTAPNDIKGMSTLLVEHKSIDDDIWVYLPSFKKVRRLSTNSKRDSFLGTDLSNGDVIGHHPKNWKHSLLREENLDNTACWVIESIAGSKISEQTGYSKRISFIRKDNFVTLKTDFWNEQSVFSKSIIAKDYKQISDIKYQPLLIEAKNHLTGHQSTIKFNKFEVGMDVSDQDLSPRAMEKFD